MRFEEAYGEWNKGQLPLAADEELEAALAAAESGFQRWRWIVFTSSPRRRGCCASGRSTSEGKFIRQQAVEFFFHHTVALAYALFQFWTILEPGPSAEQ